MKARMFFKPAVIITAAVMIALIILTCICSSARVDEKLDAASDYMQSDNIALGAQAYADGFAAAALTDGKSSTSYTARRTSDFSYTIDLGSVKEFNTIILKEDGLNVQSFRILASSDNVNFSKIFESDKIEYHRLCSVDKTVARYLRLEILESDAPACIKEFEVYNEPARDSSSFRVTGYVANSWVSVAEDQTLTYDERKEEILADMDRYNLGMLTHVFYYCGIGFNAKGEVYLGSDSLTDEEKQIKEDALALAMECLREKCRPDVKISMVFGSSTGSPVNNPAMDDNRDTFITNLINFANKFGFDGIDIDYEFPVSDYDYAVFDAFLIEFKNRMVKEMNAGSGALLSCAFGTRDINYSTEAKAALDFVNIMTYDIFDQDGYHSSFWGCGPQAGVYYESIGVAREKLNLGIPFYGTQVQALMEQYGYTNLTDRDYYRNLYTCTDYTGEPTTVYFNSPSMVRDKTAYALLSGMGGIMIWHVTADIEYDNEFSLWRAVDTALGIYGGKI